MLIGTRPFETGIEAARGFDNTGGGRTAHAGQVGSLFVGRGGELDVEVQVIRLNATAANPSGAYARSSWMAACTHSNRGSMSDSSRLENATLTSRDPRAMMPTP